MSQPTQDVCQRAQEDSLSDCQCDACTARRPQPAAQPITHIHYLRFCECDNFLKENAHDCTCPKGQNLLKIEAEVVDGPCSRCRNDQRLGRKGERLACLALFEGIGRGFVEGTCPLNQLGKIEAKGPKGMNL